MATRHERNKTMPGIEQRLDVGGVIDRDDDMHWGGTERRDHGPTDYLNNPEGGFIPAPVNTNQELRAEFERKRGNVIGSMPVAELVARCRDEGRPSKPYVAPSLGTPFMGEHNYGFQF